MRYESMLGPDGTAELNCSQSAEPLDDGVLLRFEVSNIQQSREEFVNE